MPVVSVCFLFSESVVFFFVELSDAAVSILFDVSFSVSCVVVCSLMRFLPPLSILSIG